MQHLRVLASRPGLLHSVPLPQPLHTRNLFGSPSGCRPPHLSLLPQFMVLPPMVDAVHRMSSPYITLHSAPSVYTPFPPAPSTENTNQQRTHSSPSSRNGFYSQPRGSRPGGHQNRTAAGAASPCCRVGMAEGWLFTGQEDREAHWRWHIGGGGWGQGDSVPL